MATCVWNNDGDENGNPVNPEKGTVLPIEETNRQTPQLELELQLVVVETTKQQPQFPWPR